MYIALNKKLASCSEQVFGLTIDIIYVHIQKPQSTRQSNEVHLMLPTKQNYHAHKNIYQTKKNIRVLNLQEVL